MENIGNVREIFKCRILENESTQNQRLSIAYDKLKNRLAMTKGSCFEASRRHKLRARTSQYTLIMLSLFVFFIGVPQVSFPDFFNASDKETPQNKRVEYGQLQINGFWE